MDLKKVYEVELFFFGRYKDPRSNYHMEFAPSRAAYDIDSREDTLHQHSTLCVSYCLGIHEYDGRPTIPYLQDYYIIQWENVIAMKWIPMVCSVCNSAVGEKQYRVSHNENGKNAIWYVDRQSIWVLTCSVPCSGAIPNAEAIKLYKYAVQIIMKENPADSYQFDASFQRYVAMDFIELFSAHATYKFLIHDRSDEIIHGLVSNTPKYPSMTGPLELNYKQIWVFNPDIQVYNSVSNIDSRWQRGKRLMFLIMNGIFLPVFADSYSDQFKP
jgi:HECT-like Ubiquitin-conjugating enzyme (E2)-binding